MGAIYQVIRKLKTPGLTGARRDGGWAWKANFFLSSQDLYFLLPFF